VLTRQYPYIILFIPSVGRNEHLNPLKSNGRLTAIRNNREKFYFNS
jgi:hypothetical protein